MNMPPLLLGLALLFWGWQSGFLVVALLMAAVLEGARRISVRWEFTDQDYHRLWTFTTVLVFAAAVYAFTANEGFTALRDLARGDRVAGTGKTARAALALFQWLPMLFFPLAAAQAFSTRPQISWATISLLVRWLWQRLPPEEQAALARGGLRVAWPYFGMTLFAATITPRHGAWFFAGLCALLAWALWSQRATRYAAPVWFGMLLVALGLGYGAQYGLGQLQRFLENVNPAWLSRWREGEFDRRESRTALGQVGRLKGSSRIVLRVEPVDQATPPALLREASYQEFHSPYWRGSTTEEAFGSVDVQTNETTWRLLPAKHDTTAVRVAGYLPGGRGLLAAPTGVSRLERLPVFELQTNHLGVLRVGAGPGLVVYDSFYGPGTTLDAPPAGIDRDVPDSEKPALAEVIASLPVEEATTDQVLRVVEDFFQEHFRYSTWREAAHSNSTNRTPLAQFLLEERAGHCEYFATATVLLLRQLGLPTRYAVGYAVQEKSGRQYLVRARHAHAWCLVWHDGAWHDFDTTPASWMAAEAKSAGVWSWLRDLGSRAWFEFNKWRWGQTRLRQYILWIVGPILLLLLGQLVWRRQWRRARQADKSAAPTVSVPGFDSEFYLIERRLIEQGWARSTGESLGRWLERRFRSEPGTARDQALRTLLRLHYRLRFDPDGLDAAERNRLRAGARIWLETDGGGKVREER